MIEQIRTRCNAARSWIINLVILCSLGTPANADILTVAGTSNIFAAGRSSIPPGAGDGTVPPVFTFSAANNLVLRFSSVTGSVGADVDPANLNGPDGGVYRGNVGTNINSAAGISGLIHNNFNMFLAGVFLDNSIPLIAPNRLAFSQPENFLTLSPLLGQTFFVGDGLTDSGNIQQQFFVPTGASRLYLGFVDAADPIPFQGNPGFYSDNIGSLSANFSVTAVPEPSSMLMTAAAVSAFFLRRRLVFSRRQT